MKKKEKDGQEVRLFPGKAEERRKFDPQGSYTGVPRVPSERPIQDVDDL